MPAGQFRQMCTGPRMYLFKNGENPVPYQGTGPVKKLIGRVLAPGKLRRHKDLPELFPGQLQQGPNDRLFHQKQTRKPIHSRTPADTPENRLRLIIGGMGKRNPFIPPPDLPEKVPADIPRGLLRLWRPGLLLVNQDFNLVGSCKLPAELLVCIGLPAAPFVVHVRRAKIRQDLPAAQFQQDMKKSHGISPAGKSQNHRWELNGFENRRSGPGCLVQQTVDRS